MQLSVQASPTLDVVRKIAPEIAAAAQQTEDQRAIPSAIVDRMRDAGIFRMLVPRDFGGDALTEGQACSVIEELAAADGAVYEAKRSGRNQVRSAGEAEIPAAEPEVAAEAGARP